MMKENNQWGRLPDSLLDDEGYPTNEWLEYLRQYEPDASLPLFNFINGVLRDGWNFSDWGFKLGRKYKGKIKLSLHTGGWSGNEESIQALLGNNNLLILGGLNYVSWKRGGHYYFEFEVNHSLTNLKQSGK